MISQNQDWQNTKFYFENIPEPFEWFQQFPIWQWQEKLSKFLQDFFANFATDFNVESISSSAKINNDVYFFQATQLQNEVYISSLGIYLGKGIKIDAGVTIKPSCVVLENSVIRQSAYLRSNTIVGQFCTIGHATEIKNSLVFGHSEFGHFNYIGDSLIGSYCNLGAGTILCNLPFRKIAQKKKNEFHSFGFSCFGQKILATKKGVVLGDGCETGCNSTLGPMSFLGKESIVFPNIYVSKGVYPPKSVFQNSWDYSKLNLALP